MIFSLPVKPVISAAPKLEIRDDGLTIIRAEIPKETKTTLSRLTLVIKTGYADDPAGKAGLTMLTNRMLYRVFQNTATLDVKCNTYANFSEFNFVIAAPDFKTFCGELDDIIRMEAPLKSDECRQLIRDYQNEPRSPGAIGLFNLDKLLYGNDHPYLAVFNGNFTELDVDMVNDWFQKIYRPNNLIIAGSADLPSDFLKKPGARELKEPVSFAKMPPAIYASRPEINYTQVDDNVSSIYIGIPGPVLTDDACFAAMMLQRYLQQELGNKLRVKTGLGCDLQVSYNYLQESAAPSFIISLETLPADTDPAVATILEILRQMTLSDNIQAEQLDLIKAQEKNRIELQNNSPFQVTDGLIYQKLFAVSWLNDFKAYLARFNQITADDLAHLITPRLKYVKIAITGTASEATLEQTIKVLTKLDKPVR